MTALKFIISGLIISSLLSCRQTYRLSEEEYDWMPYKGTETLVFTSKNKETDTIFFLKKDTLVAYPEAQAINGKTYEVVRIFCKHSDVWKPDNSLRYLENDFVELKKSKDKKGRLHFNLSAKDAKFYRLTGIPIDSLKQQPFKTLETKNKIYSDVYVIDDEDWMDFKQRSDYVTKLYWSKSEGLVRYDKQDGNYWELSKKYSP